MAELQDPVAFRARIMAAVPSRDFTGTGDGAGYNNAAEYTAQILLNACTRDPQAFAAAAEGYRKNPYSHDIEHTLTPEEKQAIDDEGITGFMWGWAVNAVFWLTEQEPGPNPALLTIGD